MSEKINFADCDSKTAHSVLFSGLVVITSIRYNSSNFSLCAALVLQTLLFDFSSCNIIFCGQLSQSPILVKPFPKWPVVSVNNNG